MSERGVVEGFYEALARGDVGALRASFAPGAIIWHSFDGIAQDVDTAIKALEGLIAHSAKRGFEDVRQEPISGGLLRRQLFVLTLPDGVRKAWPVCLIIRIEDGLITRMDEYMDRAGSFAPGEGEVATPGL